MTGSTIVNNLAGLMMLTSLFVISVKSYRLLWGSDQFWAELVQPGRTSKPCVARGVVI